MALRLELHQLEQRVKKAKNTSQHVQIFQDILKPYAELDFIFDTINNVIKLSPDDLQKVRQVARVLKLCRVRIRCVGHVPFVDKIDEMIRMERDAAKRGAVQVSQRAAEVVRKALIDEGVVGHRIEVKAEGYEQNLSSNKVCLIILSVDNQLSEIVKDRQRKRKSFASMFVVSNRDLLQLVVQQWKMLVAALSEEEEGEFEDEAAAGRRRTRRSSGVQEDGGGDRARRRRRKNSTVSFEGRERSTSRRTSSTKDQSSLLSSTRPETRDSPTDIAIALLANDSPSGIKTQRSSVNSSRQEVVDSSFTESPTAMSPRRLQASNASASKSSSFASQAKVSSGRTGYAGASQDWQTVSKNQRPRAQTTPASDFEMVHSYPYVQRASTESSLSAASRQSGEDQGGILSGILSWMLCSGASSVACCSENGSDTKEWPDDVPQANLIDIRMPQEFKDAELARWPSNTLANNDYVIGG